MREIKFRAWDKSECRMIYSGTEQNDYPFSWMIHNSGIDIAEHDGTDWNYLKELTFMQYTGLHDKNGVEIYEGDVCQDNYSDIYEILWSDHHQWACKLIKTDYTLSRGLTFPLWHYDNCKENGCRQLEVIGNIYENSELMKEEEH